MNQYEIHIADYDYTLEESRIAKFPLADRSRSKLLLFDGGAPEEDIFANVAVHLPADSLLVVNNTRVIQARLLFAKSTGARIEVFLLEPESPRDYEQAFQERRRCAWKCIVGNLKKWKGETIMGEGGLCARLLDREQLIVEIEWESGETFAEVLDAVGQLPIPPYLNRAAEESDKQTYQTIYSRIKGSVAAPTAGLHFTPEVLATLDGKHITRGELTLHVGAGTFKPVKSATIAGHEMHTEFISVERGLIETLLAHGCQVTAVGTTSVRTLESLYYIGCKLLRGEEENLAVGQWEPYECDYAVTTEDALRAIIDYMSARAYGKLQTATKIIIVPGFRFRIVNRLITNLHQPKSTLLLLVDAFLGGRWREAYDYALTHEFRFLSYGDACLFRRSGE